MRGESTEIIALRGKIVELAAPSISKKALSWISQKAQDWMHPGSPGRKNEDERISGTEFSLKTGIWFQFHRHTRAGEHEQLLLCEPENLIFAFMNEARNYEFADRITRDLLDAFPIAVAAAEVVCTAWTARSGANRDAVSLTNAMACYIFAKYEVKPLRRSQAAQPVPALSKPAVEWRTSGRTSHPKPELDVPKRAGQPVSVGVLHCGMKCDPA